jgi:hypothetical protein
MVVFFGAPATALASAKLMAGDAVVQKQNIVRCKL